MCYNGALFLVGESVCVAAKQGIDIRKKMKGNIAVLSETNK